MWDWAIWGALILTFLAGVAALVLVAVRVRDAWRAFANVRQNIVNPLNEVAAKAEALASRLEAAGDTAQLQESVLRLRVSLAKLDVLREALDDVQAAFERVAAVVPRK
jgi:hypothetical protein